jgi:glycosyltransferase involved in cell wall biosynthesis
MKAASRAQDGPGLNLLYAGRLVAEKGVHTAVQALEKVSAQSNLKDVRLTVAGSESNDYLAHLRHLVMQAGLDDRVSFLGHVPAEEMPQLLRQFDVLLLPSLWPEPFSRMLLEGMATGLAVVATNTGGTVEILKDGENGLLCNPGDADDLAQKVVRLGNDRVLLRRLALAGQKTVMERFTRGKMIDEFEAYLQQVVARNVAVRRPARL